MGAVPAIAVVADLDARHPNPFMVHVVMPGIQEAINLRVRGPCTMGAMKEVLRQHLRLGADRLRLCVALNNELGEDVIYPFEERDAIYMLWLHNDDAPSPSLASSGDGEDSEGGEDGGLMLFDITEQVHNLSPTDAATMIMEMANAQANAAINDPLINEFVRGKGKGKGKGEGKGKGKGQAKGTAINEFVRAKGKGNGKGRGKRNPDEWFHENIALELLNYVQQIMELEGGSAAQQFVDTAVVLSQCIRDIPSAQLAGVQEAVALSVEGTGNLGRNIVQFRDKYNECVTRFSSDAMMQVTAMTMLTYGIINMFALPPPPQVMTAENLLAWQAELRTAIASADPVATAPSGVVASPLA